MGILSFLHKPKEFFSAEDKEQIVQAIRNAERETSGEVRIYVESRNPMVNVMDRAAEIFFKLKMQNTDDRNAVLLYIAMKDRELALFGDEGIYRKTGVGFWYVPKTELMMRLATMIDHREFVIAGNLRNKDAWIAEMLSVKRETLSGNPDDMIFATALACWRARRGKVGESNVPLRFN